MLSRDEIVQQALALSPDDRAYVAELLVQSLKAGEFTSLEIAAAWGDEIERRAQAYERGEMGGEDWSNILSRLRGCQGTTESNLSDSKEVLAGESFLAELRRRSRAYRDGTTSSRQAEDVLADLRKRQLGESKL